MEHLHSNYGDKLRNILKYENYGENDWNRWTLSSADAFRSVVFEFYYGIQQVTWPLIENCSGLSNIGVLSKFNKQECNIQFLYKTGYNVKI